MRFIHPEKILSDMDGMCERVTAALFGLTRRRYRRIRRRFEEEANGAVAKALDDAELFRRIAALPFAEGETIVGLGDSITDDYQSWFRLLELAYRTVHPDRAVRFVNAGISGDTTGEMIARMLSVVQADPDWVICLVGTNDARRHGPRPRGTLLSIGESTRNIEILERTIREVCNSRSVWLTPPPVVEEAIPRHWFLGPFELSWSNRDLEAIADAVRNTAETVVDIRASFGRPAAPGLLLSDGLHPSLEGHLTILRGLVMALTDGS